MLRFAKISERKINRLEAKYQDTIEREANEGYYKALYLMARRSQLQKDVEAATFWCLKAIEKGDTISYHNLWILEDNEEKSKAYLIKGAELGDLQCRWKLGRCYGGGRFGFEKNIEKALELLHSLPADYGNCKIDIARVTAEVIGIADPY